MLAAPLVDTKTKEPIGACAAVVMNLLLAFTKMFCGIVCCHHQPSVALIVRAGMASVRSWKGGEKRFADDAEASFRQFVEVICELLSRFEVDEVMGRTRRGGRDEGY